MRRRSVVGDTIRMTGIQFVLECLILLFNAWMTRKIGAASVGILALVGSFFNLAAMFAGGNAMLCASRFVSEELGKTSGNPGRILRHGLTLCLMLSLPVAAIVLLGADRFSRHFLQDPALSDVVRFMAFLLPIGTVGACLKGYCNALCQVAVTASCDVLEFLLRAVLLILLLGRHESATSVQICTDLVYSMAAAMVCTTALLSCYVWRSHRPTASVCSLSFWRYVHLALPVAIGGCLTASLSAANDALIPITLRQFGDSAHQALEQFGVFEGIVIPVLFFPSTILCALSGILIPEVARANAAGNQQRVQVLTQRVIALTLIFAILIAAVLLRFGGQIGTWMDGGVLSGRMIRILAPVVPFIYLEIVLEALIKGMGRQSFSSLNYLAEYVIRICVVLIAIPLFGFYGIVASYYTSNVFGNCNRLRMALKAAGLRFRFERLVGRPLFAAVFAFTLAALPRLVVPMWGNGVLGMAAELFTAMGLYGGIHRLLHQPEDPKSYVRSTMRSAS